MSPSRAPAAGPVPGSVADSLARTLLDPTACPSCGARLAGPRCHRCGVDLSGEAGRRVWALAHKAVLTLREREQLLVALRSEAGRAAAHAELAAAVRGRAGRALDARGAPAPVPPGPSVRPGPPGPPGPPVPPGSRADAGRGRGVQSLLVGLGALLLAVAAVVFLAVAWDRLGLSGRAAVVAVVTAVTLGGAAFLRARLPETAEALGALGAVLVVGDAWAARATGLAGTGQVPGLLYAAVAAALAAALLGAFGALTRLRSGTVAAALLAPVAPVLAGLHAATHDAVVAPVAAGLLGGAAVAAARAVLPPGAGAEARVARVHAALQLAGATVLVAVAAPSATTAALAAACAAVLAGQALADGRPGALPSAWPRLWCLAAGATAVLTAVLGVLALPVLGGVADAGVLSGADLAPGAPGGPWTVRAAVAVAAALAGAAVLVAAVHVPRTRFGRRLAGLGLRRAALAAGAGGALVVAVLPVAVGALEGLLALAAAPVPPWRAGPATPVGELLAGVPAASMAEQLVLVAGLAVPAALAVAAPLVLRVPAHAGSGPAARAFAPALAVARRLGAVLLTAAVLGIGVLPGLPVATSAGLLALLAVAAGAAHGSSPRGLPLAVCVGASAGAVAVAWTAQATSGPVTALGVLGLLAARRVVAGAAARAALAAATVLAGGAAVTAAVAPLLGAAGPWSDLPPDVAARLAAVLSATCALAGVASLALPTGPATRRLPGERRAVAGTAATVGLLALPSPLAAGLWTSAVVVLAALLALALAASVTRLSGDGVPLREPAAGASVVLAAAVAATGTAAAGLDVAASALAAVLVAVAAAGLLVALAVGVASWPADGRRVPVEVGAAGAAAGGLLLGDVVAVHPSPGAWLLLALTGTALAAVALTPGRALLADAAVAPLAAASALLLDRAGVDVPEAYTLPPALALLALGVARLRAGAVARSWPALGPGLVLALAPSVVAPGSSLVRIVVLTLVAAGVVLAGVRARLAAPVVVGSLALASHATAQLGPWLVDLGTSVPRWTVLAAVGLLLLAVGATYERQVSRLRGAAVRLSTLR